MGQKIRVILIGAIGALLLFVSAIALQKPQWKGTITREGDVVVVKNPKDPIYKDAILTFKEELSIGGAEAKPEQSFVEVNQIVIDEDENIYILDPKQAQIKVFNKAGGYLRTIGRKGEGPGELSQPTKMSLNPSRKELMVSDLIRRQLVYFATDGKFLKNLSTGKTWGVFGKADSAGNIVVTEAVVAPPEMKYALRKYDSHMNLIAELDTIKLETNQKIVNPFMPTPHWDIDKKDNIIYGNSKTYELRVFNSQNRLTRKIIKEDDPVEVTEDEKKRVSQTKLPAGIKVELSRYRPAFATFVVDDEGRIFVLTWRRAADRGAHVYDIFDMDGRYLARQAMKADPVAWKNRKMYSVEEDDEGYQIVKRYALTWAIQ